MPNQTDYQTKLEIITAIAEEDTKSPAMPVDVYLQEAEHLYKWCQDDQNELMAVKLDWDIVLDIPVRAGALREADAIWYKQRFSPGEAKKQWQAASKQGYDLRDILLHDFYFAYDGDPGLLNRVSGIAAGNGHADMIHDLNQLAVLGREYIEPLLAVGFDTTKLQQAATRSDELATMLADAEVDGENDKRTMTIRDQAYTHLKEAVDKVRKCGQYVFWRNEARFVGYVSQYRRKANAKTRNQPAQPVAVEVVD